MNLKTQLCRDLGIRYPIFQAGMAGGPSTPELVSEVSEAGGLGALGASYMRPDELRAAIKQIKASTKKPFAVNLFCTDFTDDFSGTEAVNPILNGIRKELNISAPAGLPSTISMFDEQFQILLEEDVPIISTAFGLLPKDKMNTAKAHNRNVMAMVTTVREAEMAEADGVDIIVAQGSDAGGHRGTFDIREHVNGANIGTLSLVPQIVDRVSIPVVAAGGIMDGRGIAASLALGAQAVQMGTQFLCCLESGAHSAYKKAVLKSDEESTVITRSFSGRPARGIKNVFIEEFERHGVQPLKFPTQNTFTGDIRREAARQSNEQFMSLWAGQATRLATGQKTAGDVIHEAIQETEAALKRLITFL